MNLTNKSQQEEDIQKIQYTCIITGSTRGIGKETALLFLKNDMNVIISSRNQKSVDNIIQAVNVKFPSKKGNILGVKCDVSKYSDVKFLVDKTIEKFGRIDILVNNAAIDSYKKIIDTTEEEWNKIIDINLKGVFLFTREVLPHMIENKSGGIIINISSIAGKVGFANLSAYCASKFGLMGFTESVAKEVVEKNIKIMAICPSGVDTEMMKYVVGQGFDNSSMKLMKPEEVAEKIYDMISNQKDYTNGQSIEFYTNQ